MDAPSFEDLRMALSALDEELEVDFPEIFRELRSGAAKADLEELSHEFLQGGPLPEDLEAWFLWHDGQDGFTGLSPKNSRTLLSVERSLAAWRFLNDPMEEVEQPWRASWLPLLENGAGSYLVYESEGERAGALIAYWSDDDDRDVEHESLLDWVRSTRSALAALDETRPRKVVSAEIGKTWTRCDAPGESVLSTRPVGSAWYVRGTRPSYEVLGWQVFIKVSQDFWVHGLGSDGLEDAVRDALEHLLSNELESLAIIAALIREQEPVYYPEDGVDADAIGTFRGRVELIDDWA